MNTVEKKRISSFGIWDDSLVAFFEQFPLILINAIKFIDLNEYNDNHLKQDPNYYSRKSRELRQLINNDIVNTYNEIMNDSKKVNQCLHKFLNNLKCNKKFREQAPIHIKFQPPFYNKDLSRRNLKKVTNTEILMTSTRALAFFLFNKKQFTFINGLVKLTKLYEIWLQKLQIDPKNKDLLNIMKSLFNQLELIGMDLNLLFFQADIYLASALTMAESPEKIAEVVPSVYFLKQNMSKIFLFEEQSTWYKYNNETFQSLPKEEFEEFEEFLKHYTGNETMVSVLSMNFNANKKIENNEKIIADSKSYKIQWENPDIYEDLLLCEAFVAEDLMENHSTIKTC